MIPFILIFFIGGLIILGTRRGVVKRQEAANKEQLNQYLKRDYDANFARSKPVDDSEFIKPDLNRLPFHNIASPSNPDETAIKETEEKIRVLSEKKMVSFKGVSNVEIKNRYGVSSMESIVSWEENFQRFIRYLNEWADLLKDQGYLNDAISVLEQAIELNSELSETYIILGDLYNSNNDKAKLQALKGKAAVLGDIGYQKVLHHIDSLN